MTLHDFLTIPEIPKMRGALRSKFNTRTNIHEHAREKHKMENNQETFGPVTREDFDATAFIGVEAMILEYAVGNGQYGKFVMFKTNQLADRNGKQTSIQASALFGLDQDKDTGAWGWDPRGKLGEFLKKHNADSLDAVVGQKAIVQTKAGRDGKQFLTFV